MKKSLITAGLVAASINAYAACPSNLNGTWVASATKINTAQVTQTTAFKVLVGTISGNQITISNVFTADGSGPTATNGPFPALTFNLDKTTCTFSTTDGSGIFGAVSNGGKTLQLVQGENGQAQTMTFNKQ